MEKFERKFIVDEEGNTEKKEFTSEEKKEIEQKKKKKFLTLDKNREFVVDPDGTIEQIGSNEDVISEKEI